MWGIMSMRNVCTDHSLAVCRRILATRSLSHSVRKSEAISMSRHRPARLASYTNRITGPCINPSSSSIPWPTAASISSQLSVRRYTSDKDLPELSFEDLRALIQDNDIQLFDVREPKELEEYGSIPNSVNIPLGQVKEALLLSEEEFEKQYKCRKPQLYDTNVVFYGLGPIKSRAALQLARKLGYNKARHYGGGWEEYSRKTGQPLKK